MKIRKTLGIIVATVFTAAMLFAGGCAPKSGSTQKVNMSDWEWVPRIWVEDNSFSGSQYRSCSYDTMSEGYFCPPGTR